MSSDIDRIYEGYGWRKVATGTWFYDKIIPKPVAVWAKPARLAALRFDEDDKLVETRPIPETKGGFLYFCDPGRSGEYLTVEEAKAAADAAPWGPVRWD